MSLSRPVRSKGNARKRKANGDFANNVKETSTDEDKHFPLLDLPPELISHVFFYLGPKDRLTARVCKDLDAIEAKSKYYLDELNIKTHRRHSHRLFLSCKDSNVISLRVDKSHSIDGIKRIIQNASIRILQIEFAGSEELDRALYDLVKNIKVEYLTLKVEFSPVVKMLVKDSFIHQMPSSCKTLYIQQCDLMTAEALHEVYEAMMKGTTKLGAFSSHIPQYFHSFLSLVGISKQDDRIRSSRDIEAYKVLLEEDGECYDFHIFDGNLEIILMDSEDFLQFIPHETRESLEEAKGQLVDCKVDVIRVPQ